MKIDLGSFAVFGIVAKIEPSRGYYGEAGFSDLVVTLCTSQLSSKRTIEAVNALWHAPNVDSTTARYGFDSEPTEVHLRRRIPSDAPLRVVADMVRGAVVEALAHEVDEWLRIDGVLVTEPHPDKPRDEPTIRSVHP